MLHPFQQNDLTRDPRWRNIDFSDSQNSFFEEQTNALDLEFRNALARGSMRPFVKQYLAVTERMLQHSNQGPALLEVFPNALERLVRYFDYLRLRSREHLDENRSWGSHPGTGLFVVMKRVLWIARPGRSLRRGSALLGRGVYRTR